MATAQCGINAVAAASRQLGQSPATARALCAAADAGGRARAMNAAALPPKREGSQRVEEEDAQQGFS